MFHIHLSLFSKTKSLENEIDNFHDKLIDASMTFCKAIKTYLLEERSPDFEKYSKQIKTIEHDADNLRRTIESMGLSARACMRIIRIARTIADLEGSRDISILHLSEATGFRFMDKAL